MKKILMTVFFLFCLTGATLPAVTAYAEEKATVAKPTKPTATNVVQGIRVKWTAVEGVSKYGVWRSETGKNGTYKWLGNPGQNSYLDDAVTSGKTYFYKVTCMVPGTNTHGAKSEAGGVVYVDTPDFTQRYNKAAGIVLEWNKIDGATGYGIYRKSYAGTDEWVRIATVSGNNTFKYTDTTVQNANGSVYRYTVRALADANMKTLSGCRATGRTMVRLTSRALNSATATAGDSVKCAWTTTAQATGYEVRFMEGSMVFKTFTVGNYKTGVKTFTGLTPETTYRVQVRSYKNVDGVGSFYSAWSEAKTVTTPVEVPQIGRFPEIEIIDRNLNVDVFTSEEEANRYFVEQFMNYYGYITIYAEDISMLHTAEEYIWLCPGIYEAEIKSLKKYRNGYALSINILSACRFDREHVYALGTGDTTFLDEKQLETYNKILAVTSELNLNGKSDIEKIVEIHDYLLKYLVYDDEHAATGNNWDAQEAEGAFLQGKAVCSGYASAFRLLLSLQGIRCDMVINSNHAWNVVELEGEWYHVDVTWDEGSFYAYEYFMITNAQLDMVQGHANWECECGGEHSCDDGQYFMYPYSAPYWEYRCTTEEEARRVIEGQKGKEKVYILFPNDGASSKDKYMYPVASDLKKEQLLEMVYEELGLQEIDSHSISHIRNYYLLVVEI